MLSLNLANCFVMSEFFLNIPGLPALLEGLNTHLLTCPKMTKNGCLLSMVMSYIIGKPMGGDSKKSKKLTCPNNFLPYPKIACGP